MGWQDRLVRDVRKGPVRNAGGRRVSSVCWARGNGDPQEVDGVKFVGFVEKFSGDARPEIRWDEQTQTVVLVGGDVARIGATANRHGWIGPAPVLTGVVLEPNPELVWKADRGHVELRGDGEKLRKSLGV